MYKFKHMTQCVEHCLRLLVHLFTKMILLTETTFTRWMRLHVTETLSLKVKKKKKGGGENSSL